MVRSKKKSSSNQSSNNMDPSQFNDSWTNVNHVSGNVADTKMQNHKKMSDVVTQNTANSNSQVHNSMENTMTQNSNRKDQSKKPDLLKKMSQWDYSLMLSKLYNDIVNGQNSADSLFMPDFNLSNISPPFSFQSNFNCDYQIPPNISQSNFPHIDGQILSDNGPRNDFNGKYSNIGFNTVFAEKSYVKVLKSNSEPNEFKMRNQDFPALPSTQIQMPNVDNSQSAITDSNAEWGTTNIESELFNNLEKNNSRPSRRSLSDTDFHENGTTVPLSTHVNISIANGMVSDIPGSMLRDQFGIIGHLVSMRAVEYDRKFSTLTYGHDLTSLGMNLNSPENIYTTFAGPFESAPLGPHNIDFDVPPEYRVQDKIKDKLAPINLSKYKEDLLFYLFYTHFGEVMQMSVSDELRTRGWCYHTGYRVWFTPESESIKLDKNSTNKHGVFYVFDPQLWRKVPRELNLDQ
ncbi:CCR4-NOT transcription complex subunit 2-like isoform X1 [Aphis craccivora]|uniref:CCR4-NOT transcription complex subunit 2-like isoform X1 n=1 Tax=Aphis craccivora TaxID=307492 RepID=A0A6G0Y527_APHCR|nr:CCR4-NOT transcription complex subunit 2-like isoform X1 [Aphis craccivora]